MRCLGIHVSSSCFEVLHSMNDYIEFCTINALKSSVVKAWLLLLSVIPSSHSKMLASIPELCPSSSPLVSAAGFLLAPSFGMVGKCNTYMMKYYYAGSGIIKKCRSIVNGQSLFLLQMLPGVVIRLNIHIHLKIMFMTINIPIDSSILSFFLSFLFLLFSFKLWSHLM